MDTEAELYSQKKRYINIVAFIIYCIYFKFIASLLYAHPSRFFFWGLLNQQKCICSTDFMMPNFNALTSCLVCICATLWRRWNQLFLIHSATVTVLCLQWSISLVSCLSSEEDTHMLNTPMNTGIKAAWYAFPITKVESMYYL